MPRSSRWDRVRRAFGKRMATRRLGSLEPLEPRVVLDSTVTFNEIMYHPANDDPGLEWVELHNQLAVNMDLSGWQIRGGVDYDFAPGTILPGGGFLVVAANPANVAGSLGPFTGRLDNGSDELRLRDKNDRIMDLVDYQDDADWPAAADGAGVTLAKRDRGQASAPPENWTYSAQMGGTPGADNFAPFDNTPVQTTLVEQLDTWKYDDSGTDLGSGWTDPDYPDAGWQTGEALFYDDPEPPAPAPAVPTLVSYWTFDDTTADLSGPNDSGTLNGGAAYSTQRPAQITAGKSLQLNGSTSYFSVAPQGTLNGTYTVSMWARVANNSAATMLSSGTTFGYDIQLRNGGTAVAQVHGDIGNGTSWMSNTANGNLTYTTNTWYHVAMVVRPNRYDVYVNGVKRSTATNTFPLGTPLLWDPTHALNIGRLGNNTAFFNGFIDDVAIWSNPLGQTQITSLANGVSPTQVGPGHDGALAYIPITSDADSGIGLEKTYTHKIDFGNQGAAIVNGVRFDTAFVTGTGSTTIPAATFASDGSHNTTGSVASLFDDFIYNVPEATITLTGLSVGQPYDLRLYHRQWGAVFDRSHHIEFDTDNDGGADRMVRLNPDDASSAAPDFTNPNQAYALSYTYVARASSVVVRIFQTGGGTWHFYGLTNEVTDRRPINSLYGTGLGDGGRRLVQGEADPHYTLQPGAAQGTTAIAITNHPAWAANDAGSGFIGVVEPGTANVAGGPYVYRTNFDLTGFNPATAEITMTLWADNNVTDVLLNGVSTSIAFAGFDQNTGRTFRLTTGFQPGVNTLEFQTTNDSGPGGFRADLGGTAKLTATLPLASALVTADNHFAVYVGNPDGSNLRLVGRDSLTDWTTVESFGFGAGNGEHVFVVAWDNPPGSDQQMWIGRFVRPDGQVLYSAPTDWEYLDGPTGANPGNDLLVTSLPPLAGLQSHIAGGSFSPIDAAAANTSAPWGTNAQVQSDFGASPAQFLWGDTLASASASDGTYVVFRSKEPISPIIKRTALAEGHTTYYLRKEFQFNDDPARTVLSITPTLDDGAVVYLNGTEIYRHNLPGGPIDFSTPALADVPGEPAPMGPIIVSAGSLVFGRNVLAVELHRAAGSDDLQFGLEVSASVTPADPAVVPPVVINELPAATDANFFVELTNEGSATVDLTNYIVARLSPTPAELVLAPQSLAPGERLLLSEAQLGFDALAGDRIVLYAPAKAAVVDARPMTNRLRGRSPEHDGRWLYPSAPTPGDANSFNFHDEIVINEIMYHHRAVAAQPLIVEESEPIDIQATWFYEQSDTDLGTAWRDREFVETGWGSGAAVFYGGPFVGQPNPARQAIPTLYSTGQDNNHVVLASEGQIDPHYTVISAPPGLYDGPEARVAESDGFPIGPWFANNALSRWISSRGVAGVNDDEVVPVGTFVYRTTFDLTGFVPSSTVLSVVVGADNALDDILINGQSTGISYVGFTTLSGAFTIDSGFVSGINELQFITSNHPAGDNPAGFRAVLSGTALPIPKNTEIVLGPTTHYFRNHFQFDGDPAKTQLELVSLIDDGAVYYLNGTEVYRQNMAAGPTGHGTLATTEIAGQPADVQIVAIPAGSLRTGDNVLAVEVHQASGGFGDVSFGAELRAVETTQEARAFDESPEEWIELFNKSDHPVSLAGWKLKGGIGFDFTTETIPAGGYLVIADNAPYLQSLHPGVTIVGNYSGQLSGRSDLILLEDPNENPADEVRYFDSGHWHGNADDGGSSLELRDPDADNTKAEAWAASDESTRSDWQTITYRGVASNAPGSNPTFWHEFLLGLHDEGEFLLDDVS
ncbi:MAG: lamin tail domain-containing protein, partial [Pirellulales bacterium]